MGEQPKQKYQESRKLASGASDASDMYIFVWSFLASQEACLAKKEKLAMHRLFVPCAARGGSGAGIPIRGRAASSVAPLLRFPNQDKQVRLFFPTINLLLARGSVGLGHIYSIGSSLRSYKLTTCKK